MPNVLTNLLHVALILGGGFLIWKDPSLAVWLVPILMGGTSLLASPVQQQTGGPVAGTSTTNN